MEPDVDADFYSLEQLLDDDGLQRVMAVRGFMEKSIQRDVPVSPVEDSVGEGVRGRAQSYFST